MKKICTTLLLFIICHICAAQNVGVGTSTPTEAKLEIVGTDSAILLLQNSNIGGNIKTGLYFKNGLSYSGALLATGSTTNQTFRLGLHTYGSASPTSLIERITILDGGNVGIGNTNPTALLDVNGQIKIAGGSPGVGKYLQSDATGLASWVTLATSNLPTGTSGQTLRHNGTTYVANSNLYNDGNSIGIGTTLPISKLQVSSAGYGILHSDLSNSVQVGTYVSNIGGWLGTRTKYNLHFFTNNSNPRVTLDTNGNLGVGTETPIYLLDVNGRARLRHNGNTAGMWYNKANNTEAAFVGMYNDTTFGFYGGNGWSNAIDVKNGRIGIYNMHPTAPLSFANSVGNKISLYGAASGGHYGLGVQGALMQLYTDNSSADIAFGYGSSNSFAENMRIKGNGKVGIGTTSDYQLHVLGYANEKMLQLENTDILDAGIRNGLVLQTGGQYTGAIRTIGTSTSEASLGFYTGTGATDASPKRRMTISNNGNVGIGTLNPVEAMLVVKDTNNTALNRTMANIESNIGANGPYAYVDIGEFKTGRFFAYERHSSLLFWSNIQLWH
jgi:hypothetical protein